MMRRGPAILFLCLLVFLSLGMAESYDAKIEAAMRKVDKEAKHGPFTPDWPSLQRYKVPRWYEDAKFGIFLHWGVYSVPAFDNEWYARNMYQLDSVAYKHHVSRYGPQTKFGYKDFIPEFTGRQFDAERWAELFQRAGVRYVVPVAEHHDGFAMYANSYGPWNANTMGPKRDVIGELSAAVKKRGLYFGVSSHRAEHYWFFNGGRQFPSDVQDPQYASLYGDAIPQEAAPTTAFLRDWLARTTELVDKYNPDLIYFDWWIGQKAEYLPYLQKFAAYFYNRAAASKTDVVLNYKEQSFPQGAGVLDVERGHFADIQREHWQTDTSISWKSWGYVENDEYKSPEALVQLLVDVVSKNGNLLLNVGPKADGTIPAQAEVRLLAIGKWLEINGEAIFSTRPWKRFGEGPTESVGGAFKESSERAYTSADIRFTQSSAALYVVALKSPDDHQLLVKTLGKNSELSPKSIERVELLGSKAILKWTQNPEGLRVSLPGDFVSAYPVVLRLTGAGM